MVRAIYPGSFDPVTFGHLDIITRASKIADEVVVGVLTNNSKRPLFSVEERVKMLEDVTKELPNVKVIPFHGLTVEFAKEIEANVIIRGLRAVTDFEYELQMAQTNRQLDGELETLFLTTDLRYSNISSSAVREIASYHRDVSQFVPAVVAKKIQEKMKEKECVQR